MQTKGSSAEKIIQLCFNPRVRNFPTICEVMKILKQMWNFREVVRYKALCVIRPRVEAPLQTQRRESVRTPRWTWVCQGRLQKSNDKLFSVSTSPTPPRRTCRLLKKLLRCIILIQSLLQLKWNYQVDPDTKTRGRSSQKLSLALSRHPDEGTRCEIMIM